MVGPGLRPVGLPRDRLLGWRLAHGRRGSNFISTRTKGELILLEVANQRVFIDIWAGSDAELDAWLPKGMEFVRSIVGDARHPHFSSGCGACLLETSPRLRGQYDQSLLDEDTRYAQCVRPNP